MYTKTADGSFVDATGKVIYFSVPRFVNDIVKGDCCFICGKQPSASAPFNDEHVLPNWLLKKYDLYGRKITLPNLQGYTYSRYRVPCCMDCNTLMGEAIETPISELVKKGYKAVTEYLQINGSRLFFVWMALIFLKTHLKDRGLPVSLDSRRDDGLIGDAYRWEELHHIHCIARSFFTGAIIEESVYGTFITLRAKKIHGIESFDYGDLYDLRSVFLRLEDMCFLVVLNDSQAAGWAFHKHLLRLTGALSPLQLREVFARVAYANHLLKKRPVYESLIDNGALEYRIIADLLPEVNLQEISRQEFGLVMYSCIHTILESCVVPNREAVVESVQKGERTFLFDDAGNSIIDSMERVTGLAEGP